MAPALSKLVTDLADQLPFRAVALELPTIPLAHPRDLDVHQPLVLDAVVLHCLHVVWTDQMEHHGLKVPL